MIVRHTSWVLFRRLNVALLAAAALSAVVLPAQASADVKVLPRATDGREKHPSTTTYDCKTDPITLVPGQNLNLLRMVKTCPNASKVSGPGPATPQGDGHITYFKPNMVEVKGNGQRVTPRVDDLHLHHVVWVLGGPQFAVGEEKTIIASPEGYGLRTSANADWLLNYMLHSLNASVGRRVEVTWRIDWVPDSPDNGLQNARTQWMDVAGIGKQFTKPDGTRLDGYYPVFDAMPKYDKPAYGGNGDGRFQFPEEALSPNNPERPKISNSRSWTVSGNKTLVFGAGHKHPGGLFLDLNITRNGQTKRLFRSNAKYYEPAGAVSWDVTMQATAPDWRIHVEDGDRLTISSTYDIRKAAWIESMGILPLLVSNGHDAGGFDPFDPNATSSEGRTLAEILASEDQPGEGWYTHRQLPENIDDKAGDNLGLKSPAKLKSGKLVKGQRLTIKSFRYQQGGYSAYRVDRTARPSLIRPGQQLTFTNQDALPGAPDAQQAWHSVTSCKLPCTGGSGIGYPLADGRFESGQLGFGRAAWPNRNEEVTTGSNQWTAPKLGKGTYAYFCRIHPFMRGSFRVAPKPKKKSKKRGSKRSRSQAAAATLAAPLPSR